MKHLLLFFALLMSTYMRADDWMAQLPDYALVARVSIPGTHDSATGDGWAPESLVLASFSTTQDVGIEAQLQAGVRAFDLRPAVVNGTYLNANHGAARTSLTFNACLDRLCSFLKEHPTEFIIVHMLGAQDEDRANTNGWGELLKASFTNEAYKDYLLPTFRADLTVAELRGKILILSRNEYADKPLVGGFMRGWTEKITGTYPSFGARITGKTGAQARLLMQDISDTSGDGMMDEKVAEMTRLLDYSTACSPATTADVPWVYNFCSAYTSGGFGNISTSKGYRKNAAVTNKAMADYLTTHTGPTGIVLMDYACVDKSDGIATMGKTLVDAIIANNWKYIYEGETFTIPAEGVATFCPVQWNVTLPDGVTAYAARTKVPFEGSDLTLLWFAPIEQSAITKGEGVLLMGPAGEYMAQRTLETVDKLTDNRLVGMTKKTYVGTGKGWWLQYPDGTPTFCAMKSGSYPEKTVYIKSTANGLTPEGFAYEGDWTTAPTLPILLTEPVYDGISRPTAERPDAPVYNLLGQPVKPTRPGLYIRNGRVTKL